MSLTVAGPTPPLSPLESFVRDYVEASGGAWDSVEPQVYDVLLPGDMGPSGQDLAGRGMVRIAFDPEALPEHPGAQLAGFGAPLVDRWLEYAMRRGRSAELYLVGLNLAPYGLGNHVRRAITLGDGLEWTIERIRPLEFPQAVFWFEATFVSDQKEQEIVPVAIDLHYLRQVRHLELLLDPARLAERPAVLAAEARRSSVKAAYNIARDRVLRTFAAVANARSRDLSEHTERQVARMALYYADLRAELAEQRARAESRPDPSAQDLSKFSNRLEVLDREERVRIAELRQKSALRIELRLLNLLIIRQPKLLVLGSVARAAAVSNGTGKVAPPRHSQAPRAYSQPAPPARLEMVWDPLTESLEAGCCPVCRQPTYQFTLTRHGTAACPDCAPGASKSKG